MKKQTNEKEEIMTALYNWIKQRPGLQFANYGDVKAYRAELRGITKDGHQARALLDAIRWREDIGADELKAALRGAFSGRLSWVPVQVWRCNFCAVVCGVRKTCCGKRMRQCGKLEYCTGQYWPTEYRRAVCAVAVSALWDHFRANMPKGVLMHNSETGETLERYEGLRAGDWIRREAKRELGATIARRWFY
jgi:hypothetical protein